MPICSQTVNRERRQLFDTSILVVENHVNKRLAGEIFGRDVPYEQRGFGTPDGRTKIMELPSIGERLHYTWRSYSVTLYRMHACACTSLPRMRTISTSGLRDHTNLISFIICYLVTLSRVERVRVSVFFFILYDSKTRASLFQTLLDFWSKIRRGTSLANLLHWRCFDDEKSKPWSQVNSLLVSVEQNSNWLCK